MTKRTTDKKVTAEFVRELDGWKGHVKLYKLSDPVEFRYRGDMETTDHIAISGILAWDTGRPETFVFFCDEHGEVLSWLQAEGSLNGSIDHEEALKGNDFEALHRECWLGLNNMWQRDLLRDFKIAKHLGVELRTPYMDEEVIKTAMSIHPMYKLDQEQKKIILREAAEDFGLDKEFAQRKKKAAQDGSNFIKGIDKLAKKHGFQTKKEYLQSLANRFK